MRRFTPSVHDVDVATGEADTTQQSHHVHIPKHVNHTRTMRYSRSTPVTYDGMGMVVIMCMVWMWYGHMGVGVGVGAGMGMDMGVDMGVWWGTFRCSINTYGYFGMLIQF